MFSQKLPEKIRPYSGIIYFMLMVVLAHFLWKFTVLGDDTDTIVTFLGLNVSAPFNFMAQHVAQITTKTLHLFGSGAQLLENNVIKHENGVAVRIVWSCTGIKQAFIFFSLIAFSEGKKISVKLWYLMLGLILIYIVNLVRIVSITALVESFPSHFDFLHEYLFKYLFYLIMFGMWVFWDEKIK